MTPWIQLKSLCLFASKETSARWACSCPDDHQRGEIGLLERGCFYLASDVTGSPQLPRFLAVLVNRYPLFARR
ncbi:hypothetical protein ILYODFUR_027659 [Ilyodon furcidens]|uniref:Uncharacterized protein n=1 Tax=Ilyodon furcidens TaxID=33524 RepID=A0ABV0UY36_9TELE